MARHVEGLQARALRRSEGGCTDDGGPRSWKSGHCLSSTGLKTTRCDGSSPSAATMRALDPHPDPDLFSVDAFNAAHHPGAFIEIDESDVE
jgi:hypothetical protein